MSTETITHYIALGLIWIPSGVWVGYRTWAAMRQDGIKKPHSAICAVFVGGFGIIAVIAALLLLRNSKQ